MNTQDDTFKILKRLPVIDVMNNINNMININNIKRYYSMEDICKFIEENGWSVDEYVAARDDMLKERMKG